MKKSLLASLTCDRCHKSGDGIVTHPAIGKVCAFCWTPEDDEKVWPERAARGRAWRAALAEMSAPHEVPRCEALRREFNIACPIHDQDDDSEKEEE